MTRTQHRTCLSTESHVDNIKDYLVHFLGCISISEREQFLDDEFDDVWLLEVLHHIDSGETESEAKRLSDAKRKQWREHCLRELEMIGSLRARLQGDDEEKSLVLNLEESRRQWETSKEYKEGMELIQDWKERPEYTEHSKGLQKKWTDSAEHAKCRIMAEKWKNSLEPTSLSGLSMETATSTDRLSTRPRPVRSRREVSPTYRSKRSFDSPIIQLRDGVGTDFEILPGTDDGKVWGSFPNQKTTVEHLLDRTLGVDNIMHRKYEKTIRYFHIPSNNMAWAEEAVARYFNERRPKFYKHRREVGRQMMTQTAMVMSDSFWHGQLRGGRLAAEPQFNSWFMRPLCEALSSSTSQYHRIPKDIVLFMPYLDWETSRNREIFAQRIDQIVERQHRINARHELGEKKRRQAARRPLHQTQPQQNSDQPVTQSWIRQRMDIVVNCFKDQDLEVGDPPVLPELGQSAERRPGVATRRILTMGALAERIGRSESSVSVDSSGRLLIKHSPLGQYLVDAARLLKAMTTYRDKRLLEEFLTNEPPLHPRRTLDQAYYWTLKTTRLRDKDQVVYRATTARGSDFHKYHADTRSWPDHTRFEIDGSCRDCLSKIKKVSRVLMVDQLWMWIIDSDTIITCFPDRYGTNKIDPSGVHKSIRTRLDENRHRVVKSVWDLALIIFEECSNALFDRTKISDEQPQVLDIFSEAIGNVMQNQTEAFQRLWRSLDEARRVYKSSARVAGSRLVDITLEGELEQEIKDIVEELGIMIHISKTQLDVLRSFIRQVKNIIDPAGEYAAEDDELAEARRRLGGLKRYAERAEYRKMTSEADTVDEFDLFTINSNETLTRLTDRIAQLEELQRSAEATAIGVRDLLELKQQQAGIIQAWQSVMQSDETYVQGQAIMVFTIVTIIFLPLSFMSSVFGMNTKEFGGDDNLMHLKQQFTYIVGISAPVIFVILVISLNNWTSALVCLVRWALISFSARTGLYQHYLRMPNFGLHEDELKRATDQVRNEQKKLLSQRRLEKYSSQENEGGVGQIDPLPSDNPRAGSRPSTRASSGLYETMLDIESARQSSATGSREAQWYFQAPAPVMAQSPAQSYGRKR